MCSGSIRRMETSLSQGVGNIVQQTSTLQFLNHNWGVGYVDKVSGIVLVLQ